MRNGEDIVARRCKVCAGLEFELDEDENLLCVLCGTVSNQFLSQAKDVEDGSTLLSSKRSTLKRQRTDVLESAEPKSGGKKRKTAKRILHASSIEYYLGLFQKCLVHRSAQLASRLDINQDGFLGKMGLLWSKYLEAMIEFAPSAGVSSTSGVDDERNQHFLGVQVVQERTRARMVLPARQQFPAFLYLCLRLHNLVLPPNYFSSLLDNPLPRHNLSLNGVGGKQAVGMDLKGRKSEALHRQHGRNLLRPRDAVSVSLAETIWYQTNLLASILDLRIPPPPGSLLSKQLSFDLGIPPLTSTRTVKSDQTSLVCITRSSSSIRRQPEQTTAPPKDCTQLIYDVQISNRNDMPQILRWLQEEDAHMIFQFPLGSQRFVLGTSAKSTDAFSLLRSPHRMRLTPTSTNHQQLLFSELFVVSHKERMRNCRPK